MSISDFISNRLGLEDTTNLINDCLFLLFLFPAKQFFISGNISVTTVIPIPRKNYKTQRRFLQLLSISIYFLLQTISNIPQKSFQFLYYLSKLLSFIQQFFNQLNAFLCIFSIPGNP